MYFSIPVFVPVPSPETIRMISIILLALGVCLAAASVFFLFSRGKRAQEKSCRVAWIFMGAGVLLILNHGIQLLF